MKIICFQIKKKNKFTSRMLQNKELSDGNTADSMKSKRTVLFFQIKHRNPKWLQNTLLFLELLALNLKCSVISCPYGGTADKGQSVNFISNTFLIFLFHSTVVINKTPVTVTLAAVDFNKTRNKMTTKNQMLVSVCHL